MDLRACVHCLLRYLVGRARHWYLHSHYRMISRHQRCWLCLQSPPDGDVAIARIAIRVVDRNPLRPTNTLHIVEGKCSTLAKVADALSVREARGGDQSSTTSTATVFRLVGRSTRDRVGSCARLINLTAKHGTSKQPYPMQCPDSIHLQQRSAACLRTSLVGTRYSGCFRASSTSNDRPCRLRRFREGDRTCFGCSKSWLLTGLCRPEKMTMGQISCLPVHHVRSLSV